MTIEEKAKAYDKALKQGQQLKRANPYDTVSDMIDSIFPELKENEDEKIRKELIKKVQTYINGNIPCGYDAKKALAWLEKQGEQNPAVTPKFSAGDWIVNKHGDIIEITDVYEDTGMYEVIYNNIILELPIKYIDDNCHLWTIQDAKNGDVLTWDGGRYIVIFKEIKDNKIIVYCSYNNHTKQFGMNTLYDTTFDAVLKFIPATKGQSVMLFKAIADASYDWDADRKELRKIEQKPADWSEEADKMFNHLKGLTFGYYHCCDEEEKLLVEKAFDWLKSLRLQKQCGYNPYKAVVESIAEMCKHYDKASHSALRDFYDNVKVKCKDAKEYDSKCPNEH